MYDKKTRHRMWPQIAPALLTFILLLLAASAGIAQEARETLTIMVEDAAATLSKSDGTGYANDVVVAAFKEMGIEVRLRVVPYSSCKYLVFMGGGQRWTESSLVANRTNTADNNRQTPADSVEKVELSAR